MNKVSQTIKLILMVACQSVLLFGDHTTQHRKNCKILPKYKAVSRIKPSNRTSYYSSQDTGCKFATAIIDSAQLPGGVDLNGNSYAHQEVHIGDDGFTVGGYANSGWQRGGDVPVQLEMEKAFSQ